MCETAFDNAPSLTGDLNELACKVAAHGEHGWGQSDQFFFSYFLALRLDEEAYPVVANLVDRMAKQELDTSQLEFEHFPRVAAFFKRILEILHSRPREAPPKLLFDDRVGAFLRSEEPQLLAYAVTEARTQLWPIVTEFCIPYVTNFDWVISAPLYRLKDGERDVLALLRPLDATSARVLAEIVFFVLNPDQLAAPPLAAPFIQNYATAALLSSDVRGLELLLQAGVSTELKLTISKVTATLLSQTVMNAVCNTVAALLLRYDADPNVAGPEGISLLHFAAATGDMALVRMLVDAGASVDAVLPDTDITPAVMAASNDKMDVAAYLESKCKPGSPTRSVASLSLGVPSPQPGPCSPAPPYTHTPPLCPSVPPPYASSPSSNGSAWSSKEDLLFSSSSSTASLRPGYDFSGLMLPPVGHERHANKFATSLALQRSTLAGGSTLAPGGVPPLLASPPRAAQGSAGPARVYSGLAQMAARVFRCPTVSGAAPAGRQASFTTTTTTTTTTTSTTVVAEPQAQPTHTQHTQPTPTPTQPTSTPTQPTSTPTQPAPAAAASAPTQQPTQPRPSQPSGPQFSVARAFGVRAAPAALCGLPGLPPLGPSPLSQSCPDLSDTASP